MDELKRYEKECTDLGRIFLIKFLRGVRHTDAVIHYLGLTEDYERLKEKAQQAAEVELRRLIDEENARSVQGEQSTAEKVEEIADEALRQIWRAQDAIAAKQETETGPDGKKRPGLRFICGEPSSFTKGLMPFLRIEVPEWRQQRRAMNQAEELQFREQMYPAAVSLAVYGREDDESQDGYGGLLGEFDLEHSQLKDWQIAMIGYHLTFTLSNPLLVPDAHEMADYLDAMTDLGVDKYDTGHIRRANSDAPAYRIDELETERDELVEELERTQKEKDEQAMILERYKKAHENAGRNSRRYSKDFPMWRQGVLNALESGRSQNATSFVSELQTEIENILAESGKEPKTYSDSACAAWIKVVTAGLLPDAPDGLTPAEAVERRQEVIRKLKNE